MTLVTSLQGLHPRWKCWNVEKPKEEPPPALQNAIFPHSQKLPPCRRRSILGGPMFGVMLGQDGYKEALWIGLVGAKASHFIDFAWKDVAFTKFPICRYVVLGTSFSSWSSLTQSISFFPCRSSLRTKTTQRGGLCEAHLDNFQIKLFLMRPRTWKSCFRNVRNR